jgi:hypothetical protein
MATLAEMRRKVYTRLRDWGGDVWNEFELNQILNEAQDNFTRDTGYLRSVIIMPITDDKSVYTLTPPSGYRIGDTLSVIYYDGVRDYPALIPVSLRQLELMSPDYRHVTGSVPMYVVRNFNPETTAPTKDTFYLYPTPDGIAGVYTGPWPLTFTGGGGTGANGTANFTSGVVTSITFNVAQGGTGYTSAPTVGLATTYNGMTMVPGTGLQLTATINGGGVNTITINNGGSGYIATSKQFRVNVTLMTDNQMTTDDTEMALPERLAEEALISYAVAEAFVRESLASPDKSDAYIKQSQYYRDIYTARMVRAAAEAKTGFDRGMNTVRGYWV